MRSLLLLFSISAWGLAATVETTAVCSGDAVHGTYSAACSTGGALISAKFTRPWAVEIWMNSLVFEATGSASVQLVADFTLNAVGGTGDGYAEACLSAFGDRPTFSSSGVAEASFGNALGSTAVASAGYPSMSCDSFPPSHGFLPFRFGVPLTATLRLSATGYTQYGGTTQASAELWGFQFFDPEMQLLSGIRYTLTPAEPLPPGLPEPATLPLVGASASLVLVAARLRQPKA